MTTATATEPPLLPLLWLASPALPVGGFSYSEGLEAAVDAGLVQGEAQARDWLIEQLHLTLSRGDLAVIAPAWTAWHAGDPTRLRALDDWVLHTRETAELRQQTLQMGRSLIEWLRVVHPGAAGRAADMHWTDVSPTWPVAWAIALAASGARARDGLLAHAFGWAENMMQAAIKAVPLGQSAGQRMLAALAAEIPSAVDHALGLDDATRQAFSPRLAILSSQHESQYSRLFRS